MEWFFDGIGTQIIASIIGLIVGAISGGAVGYRIGLKNHNKQTQKAKDNANQVQIGNINVVSDKEYRNDKRKSNPKSR